MGDEVALHRSPVQVDDVEARLARRLGEIDDSDDVARTYLVAVRVERGLGALEQRRIDCGRTGLRRGNRRERIARRRRRRLDYGRKADRARGRREHRSPRPDSTQTQHFPTIEPHYFPALGKRWLYHQEG